MIDDLVCNFFVFSEYVCVSFDGPTASHLKLSLLFDLASFLNDTAELGVLLSQALILVVQVGELGLAVLVGNLKGSISGDTGLLRQFLVLFLELCTVVLGLGQLGLRLIKFVGQIVQLNLILLVLRLDILHLLARMRQHNDVVDDFGSETRQFLVPLLNLLVQGLVLDLELLVVDKVETLSELLLLLEDLLLVGQSVPQGDVLETILMNFLIFGLISLLPVFDHLGAELLSRAAVDGVHGDTTFELLELLLNLCALGLLLVQLVLEFTGHAIVTVLSFFQVVSDLMHVGQRVQILVLV